MRRTDVHMGREAMGRYIDADYVNAFPIRIDHYDEEHGNRHFVLGIESVMEYIEEAPSIDIEPKRGEWVKRTHNTLIAQVNFAYCSECGQPIMHEHTRSLWSFCPNCGADMREREGE